MVRTMTLYSWIGASASTALGRLGKKRIDKVEVAARHEVLAIAANEHAADCGIMFDIAQERGHRRQPLDIHRVRLFGLVERDGGYGAIFLEQQGFRHRCLRLEPSLADAMTMR
jgi:hypothetical protein